jgi:hypothetical protein
MPNDKPMTAQQLIDALKKFPPDTEVFIYEGPVIGVDSELQPIGWHTPMAILIETSH